jgi:hypothetical protein
MHYFLPALFAGSYFAVSKTRGVAQGIKNCHWDPSVERAVKTVRQREQFCEPCCTMIIGLKDKAKQLHITVFLQRK